MMNSFARTALALTVALAAASSCRHEEKFPKLGTNIVSPVDVATSDDGAYFYVLNADMDRTYNAGSILVLDKDGERVGATQIPRMGRTLTVSGKDMLVSVDDVDLTNGAALMLFSLDDPKAPRLVKKWDLDCSPYSAVMRKDYKYFAFTCLFGRLFIGELTPDRANSEIHPVRNYGTSRRAMFLDPRRNLLFGFTTDDNKQTTSDLRLTDLKSYDEKAVFIADAPDEIPDEYQKDQRALTIGSRETHQFIVYDIAKEAGAKFPDRGNEDPLVASEQRWIYFNLANFDGTPDIDLEPGQRYYRTNFWSAQPDADDPNAFYLSHRGPPPAQSSGDGSPYANQIVKVSIVGDPRTESKPTEVTVTDPTTGVATQQTVNKEKPHKTEEFFTFERVYGFRGAQTTKLDYPGEFKITKVDGQNLLLVNNFRDLVNWARGDTYFSLVAATLGDDNLWFAESCPAGDPAWYGCSNTKPDWSWYQVAVNNQGRAVSLSFYGNAVMLLDVRPGVGIKLVKRIQ